MSQPLILIQARENSTRFPRKIYELIGHKRMIDHVVDRVRLTGLKYALCRPQDWPAVKEEDVLGRFSALLENLDPGGDQYDPVVRVTADCPMLDPGIVSWVLGLYRQHGNYALVGTSPAWDGLDVEVLSRRALARAHEAAWEPREREHVTLWTRRYGRCYEIPLEGSPLRWSVDDREGLEFVRAVFNTCVHCRDAVPHHTNSRASIGGSADRQPVWDLHHLERGDLVECVAADLLMTRTGGPIYVSP